LLRAEMAQRRLLGDARALGHRLKRRLRPTISLDLFGCRLQQRLARALLGLRARDLLVGTLF